MKKGRHAGEFRPVDLSKVHIIMIQNDFLLSDSEIL